MQFKQQSADGAQFAGLLAFTAVAEERSFTRAARRLGRDATVLSRRVRVLEERLAVRLLERTTRSVRLTEAGRLYLDRARSILRSMEEAEREAGSFATGTPRGHLRLALPGTFGRMWLADLIAEFLVAYPEITIEAQFDNRFVDLIGEGFDLGIRLGELTDSRLVARKIGERRRMLCAAPAYLARTDLLRHPDQLAGEACLMFSGLPSPFSWEMKHGSGETARVTVSGPLVSDDAEVLLRAAVAGAGILLATDWLVSRALAEGVLVPVLDEWQVVDAGAIYIVTPSGTQHATKTRAFNDWIVARFETLPWLNAVGAVG